MSMRDEYRTRAAEFQARAVCASNEAARQHFDAMAEHYLQLAELEAQIDCLREFTKELQSDRKQKLSA
jgi:hypothetical protein